MGRGSKKNHPVKFLAISLQGPWWKGHKQRVFCEIRMVTTALRISTKLGMNMLIRVLGFPCFIAEFCNFSINGLLSPQYSIFLSILVPSISRDYSTGDTFLDSWIHSVQKRLPRVYIFSNPFGFCQCCTIFELTTQRSWPKTTIFCKCRLRYCQAGIRRT